MTISLAMQIMKMELDPSVVQLIEKPINPELIKQSKVNAYGTGEYLDVDTFRRILNKVTGYKWSWEILNKEVIQDGVSGYVEILGRLSIPGIGVKDAYGSQPLNKKDQSQASKMAAAYAFKNACKMVGIGGSLDEDWDLNEFDEYEPEPIVAPVRAATIITPGALQLVTPPVIAQTKFSQAQLDRMADFKADFELETAGLSPFVQAWKPEFKDARDITPENMDDFLDWAELNAVETREELGL